MVVVFFWVTRGGDINREYTPVTNTWICFVGDFLRIVPWDSSLQINIWENTFGTFSKIEQANPRIASKTFSNH